MTIAAAVLLILGAVLELVALELGRRDLRDAAAAAERRRARMPTMMATGKHAIDDWITQATRTNTWGIWFFGAGVVVQMIAGLVALS